MKINFKTTVFQLQKLVPVTAIFLMALSGYGAIIPRLKHGENLKLAAIGTSLTDKGSGNKGWFEHTGEWLNELPYRGKVTCSNHAVGGSASKTGKSDPGYHPGRYGLLQLSDVLANENPDAIFIEFAINDAFLPYHISNQASEENLQTMIDQINEWAKKQNQGKGKKVDIVVQTMNNCINDHAEKRPNLEQYYEGYKTVVRKNRGVLLIDNYANWMTIYNSQTDHATWKSYVPDGIHPNADGDREVVIRHLQKKLKKQHK
jgi:lysophospholipase L1-like esterase